MQRAPLTFLSNDAKFIMYKDLFYVFNITISYIYFLPIYCYQEISWKQKSKRKKICYVFHNIFH